MKKMIRISNVKRLTGTFALQAGTLAFLTAFFANAQGLIWKEMPQGPGSAAAVWASSASQINGAVFANGNVSGEEPWRLFDHVTNSGKWNVNAGAGWVVYQFKNSDKWVVKRYTLWTANDAETRDPRIWWLEGSNDLLLGSNATTAVWTRVHAWTNSTANVSTGLGTRNTAFHFYCPGNTTAYNAHRLRIFANNGNAYTQLCEWQMFGDNGGMGVGTFDAANVGCFTADAPCGVFLSGDTVDVHADWGTDPAVFANGGTMMFEPGVSQTTNLAAKLTGLMPDTQYHFRHRIEESATGAWAITSGVTRAFTTLGAVTFPNFFAYNEEAALSAKCTISHYGVAPVTMKFWLGTTSGSLVDTQTFNNVASGATCHAETTCEVGTLYYYQFTAEYEYNNKTYVYASSVKQIRPLPPGGVKTLYWGGGSADIANGTPLPTTAAALTGTWNKTLRNWSVDQFGSQYVAWTDGDDMVAELTPFANNATATITLGADVTLNRLIARFTNSDGRYAFSPGGGATTRVMKLAGKNPDIYVSGVAYSSRFIDFNAGALLAADNGFSKTGSNHLYVYSASDNVRGRVTVSSVNDNGLALQKTFSMKGVEEFNILHGSGMYVEPPDTNTAYDRLGDNAVVRAHGTGIFRPNMPSGSDEMLGRLLLDSSAWVRLDVGGGGSLTLKQGVDRGRDGKGVLLIQGNANDAFSTRLVVNNAAAIPQGVPLPWAFTTQARPVKFNGAEFVSMASEVVPAPPNLSTWHLDPGKPWRVEGTFTPSGAITNTTVKFLGVFNTNGGFNLSIAAGNTLTIESGQLCFIYNTAGGERGIYGGAITSGTNELYILSGNNGQALRIGSSIAESACPGNMDVIKNGDWHLYLQGVLTNTFKGTFYANHGDVTLNKDAPPAISGNRLVINRGSMVQTEQHTYDAKSNQIATGADVLVREGGILRFRYCSRQNLGGVVTLENGRLEIVSVDIPFPGIQFTAPGTGLVFANGGRIAHTDAGKRHPLQLFTNLRVDAASSNQAFIATSQPPAQNQQRLILSGGGNPQPVVRTFEVHDAIGLAPGVPELVVDMPLETENNIPVELVKTGNGVMALERLSGRFRGSATVAGGTLLVNGLYATQSVMTVSIPSLTSTLPVVSTAGLHITQPTNLGQLSFPATNPEIWVANINNATTFTTDTWIYGGTYNAIFYAVGALGRAPVTVEKNGTLGGTGGVGGNVLVAGGTLCPGTPAKPFGEFNIGGNLEMQPGSSWQVSIPATGDCNTVHIAGNVTLAGTLDAKFEAKRPVGKYWTIATFGGSVAGAMTAPQGCRVRVVGNEVQLHSSEAGTLLMVR